MLLLASGRSRDASEELGNAGEEDLEVVPLSGMRLASRLLESGEVNEADGTVLLLIVSALAVSAPFPFCSCLP